MLGGQPADVVSIVVLVGTLSSIIIGLFQYIVSFQKKSMGDLETSNEKYFKLVERFNQLSLKLREVRQDYAELQEEFEELKAKNKSLTEQRDKATLIARTLYDRWKACEDATTNPPEKS